MTSTKPYLIRAIYEWILDNDMTPHLVVDVHYPGTQVPDGYAEEGRIVLNVAPGAVQALVVANDRVEFNARFGGVARHVDVPVEAVLGIFTRENGQGMIFPEPVYPSEQTIEAPAAVPSRTLKAVRSAPGKPKPFPPEPPGNTPKKPRKGGPHLKVVK